MSDYRTPVVFKRGTDDERLVVFNEDAPSRSQSLAASGAIFLLVYLGGAASLLAWALTAAACAAFYGSIGRSAGEAMVWGLFGLAVAGLKPVFAMAMKATHDRGSEPAAWHAAAILLAVCAGLSLVASVSVLSGHLGLFAYRNGFASYAAAGLIGTYLAIAIEGLATLGPWVIVTSTKAMRESYERPDEAAIAPAMLEPALNSFEQGFSRWAQESLQRDVSGRLSSPEAFNHFRLWAQFNGPYLVPPVETFGKALASYCQALGAAPSMSSGRRVYQGASLINPALSAPKLPAIAR